MLSQCTSVLISTKYFERKELLSFKKRKGWKKNKKLKSFPEIKKLRKIIKIDENIMKKIENISN